MKKEKEFCRIEDCENRCYSRFSLCKKHKILLWKKPFNAEEVSINYKKYVRSSYGRYTKSKTYAKSRGLEWGISKEEHIELLKKTCYYCEGPLNETSVGLDRKDNNKGYTIDNVVPCCCVCNRSRGDYYTVEEFKIMVEALALFRKSSL